MKRVILLLILIMCIFTGCSNKQTEAEETSGGTTEYVYVPSFYGYNTQNIWISWISSTVVYEDKLIAVSTGFEGIRKSIVSEIDINTGASKPFDMKLDERRFVAGIMETDAGFVAYTEEFMTKEEHSGYGNPPWKASYLVYYDESFNIINEVEITDCIADITGWSSLYSDIMEADGEGNIYIYVNGVIYAISKEGSLMAEIIPKGSNIMDIEYSDDGMLVLYVDGSGDSVVSQLNVSEGALGEAFKNTPRCIGYGNGIKAGENGVLYFFTDDGVYEYNQEKAECKEILAWVDCNIMGYGLRNCTIYNDRIICTEQVSSTIDTGVEYDIIVINKVNRAEVKEKTTLTVTMLRRDSWLMDFMASFNRRNPDYRLEAVYYTEDATKEAMEAAVNQFNMDLINGKVGDIIIVTSELDYYNLAAKGTFAGLDELIEQDSELDKEDFIENIIDLLRVDGKLYGIAPSFVINTLVGKTSNVGEDGSWNISDVMDMLSEHENSYLLGGMTKNVVLERFLVYSMDSYYNPVTGECNFNSDEFKMLLTLADKFPETLGEYEFEADDYLNEVKLLEQVYYANLYDHQLYRRLFGEDVTFVGYPVEAGSGSIANFGNGLYAINAKSEHKEAAWQYIRQFFLEEYQSGVSLPVNKNVLEDRLTEAVTAEKVNHSSSYNDLQVKLEPVSEEDAENIRALIYGVTRSSFYDYEMVNIIIEEAAGFFSGQKTVDEVADIIQSRVQVFVDERR